MFPSLSKCAPGAIVESQFTAGSSFSLNISTDVQILLNGILVEHRPIGVTAGTIVTARLTAPLGFLEHTIVSYTINSVAASFAAVTKSKHTVVFSETAGSDRWWEIPTVNPHVISYRNNTGNKTIFRDLGYNAISVLDEYEAIPDPQSQAVYFYNRDGVLIENLLMPAKPVQCAKYTSATDNFFIVCCDDGYVYKVEPNLQILQQPYLEGGPLINRQRGRSSDWLFLLSYEIDIPFRGSFVNTGGTSVDTATSQTKCVSCAAGRIWVGGAGKIWALNPDFSVIREFTTFGHCAGIVALENSAVATTKYGTVELALLNEPSEETFSLYEDEWMSNPVKFGDYVAVGNSTRSSLLLFSVESYSQSEVDLGDFAPSYLSVSDSKLYISGHDTNIIKIYDGISVQTDSFADKVTWVQSVGDGVIVSHYLRGISVLQHDERQTIIPFSLPTITGGLTWVGGGSHEIINLGQESISAIIPDGVRYWSDGLENGPLDTGSVLTFAAEISEQRSYSFPIIIGDLALDFLVNGVIQTYAPRDIEFGLSSGDGGLTQHDFYYPNGYPPAVASLDCGHILKNFQPYYGDTIEPGDVVSVCIPFGNEVNPVVSVFTLGNSKFYIPVNPTVSSELSPTVSGAAINSISSTSVVVSVAGDYYFPPSTSSLTSAEIQLLGRPIVNIGGQPETAHPFSAALSYESAITEELQDTYARVPSTAGLFDVYFDAGAPHVLTSFFLMPRWGQVQLTPETVIESVVEAPINFRIWGSSDATTWVQLASYTGLSSGWQKNTFREFQFSNSTAYRYWRLQNTTTQGGGVSILRWKVRGLKKDIEITVNGTVAEAGIQGLQIGDVVEFQLGNSPRIWDSRHAKIVGPQNIDFKSTTISLGTISFLDFGSITDAYVRVQYELGPLLISTTLENVELFTRDTSLKLRKNSDIEFSDTLTVINGDTVSIRKTVRSLFQKKDAILVEQEDPTFQDLVQVEVGTLTISSEAITGSLRYSDNFRIEDTAEIELIEPAQQIQVAVHVSNKHSLTELEVDNPFDALRIKNTPKFSQVLPAQLLFNADFYSSSVIPPQLQLPFNPAAVIPHSPHEQHYSEWQADVLPMSEKQDLADLAVSPFDTVEFHDALKLLLLPPTAEIFLHSPETYFYMREVLESLTYTPSYSTIPVLQHERTENDLMPRVLSTFPGLLVHDNLKESATFSPYLVIDNPRVLESFVKLIDQVSFVEVPRFEMYVAQAADKIRPPIVAIKHEFNHTLFSHYSFLVDVTGVLSTPGLGSVKSEQTEIALERFIAEQAQQITYVIDGAVPLRIDDIIWTTDAINDYGAFATQQQAAAAAAAVGITQFIVLPIPGTTSFTYRKLSDISRVCGIIPVPSIRAIAGLIQGG